MPNSELFPGNTGDLFDAAEPQDASLNLDQAVRRAMAAALKQSDRSREQVAETMTRLVGSRVTVAMLNDFTAETKSTHRFPAAWLAAFCFATGTTRVLTLIAESIGCQVIGEDEAMLIDLAKNYLAKKKAAEKLESLEARLARRSGE